MTATCEICRDRAQTTWCHVHQSVDAAGQCRLCAKCFDVYGPIKAPSRHDSPARGRPDDNPWQQNAIREMEGG